MTPLQPPPPARLPSGAVRRFFYLVINSLVVASTPAVLPAAPTVLVDVATGEIFLENFTLAPVSISAYSIVSPNGGLVPGGWTPIAGNYDSTGDGSIDAAQPWIRFSSSTDLGNLSEGVLLGAGGTLAPGQRNALGTAWSTVVGDMSLTATYLEGFNSLSAAVVYRYSPGDFDRNLVIDEIDYAIFLGTFGQTIDRRADGNNDGVVDAADYTVWRDNLGLGFSVLPVVVGGGDVPEPSMLTLAVIGGGMLVAGMARRTRLAPS